MVDVLYFSYRQSYFKGEGTVKFNVSKEIIKIYRKHNKSEDYSLDFLLSSLDPECCAEAFALFDSLNIKGEKVEIDINESNLLEIKSLFSIIDNKLMEKLLFTAVLFPEI